MRSPPADPQPLRHPVLAVVLPFAGGYFVSYLFRTVNAVIAPDLVADFALAPRDLGLLTSAYFASFALFQLPLGIAGWRGVFYTLAVLTLAVAAAVFLVVPERPVQGPRQGLREQMAGVGGVFASRRFWQVTLAAMFSQSTFMSIQGLWAGPWFRDVAGLERAGVANHLLFVALSTMTGALVFGNAASWLYQRGVPTIRVFKAGLAAALLAQAAIVSEGVGAPAAAWVLYGLFISSSTLSYSVLSQHFPQHLAGRVNTALNLMVFLCAFASQWGIGAVINLWPVSGGQYHPAGYQASFGLFLALQAAAWVWLMVDEARAGRLPAARKA